MKRLLTLILVVGMLLVPGTVLAWGTVEVGGSAYQQTDYGVGNINNGAGGYSYSGGTYHADGYFFAIGGASADGETQAWKAGTANFKAAAAYTTSNSEAGAFTLGCTETSVYGGGEVVHNTLINSPTGGQTGGYAAYTYGATDSGYLISYNSGEGFAATGGATWRTQTPNGVTSHAVSGSIAMSHAH